MFAQSLPLILTLLAIGAGIFFNNRGLADLKADLKADIASLKADTKADIARLDSRLNMMQTDLHHFYELKGHLEGRIDEIAKRVSA
jgi:hypothetical protein